MTPCIALSIASECDALTVAGPNPTVIDPALDKPRWLAHFNATDQNLGVVGADRKGRQPFGIAGKDVGQELEGNLAIQGSVVGEENLTHPSLSKLFYYSIVREDLIDFGHAASAEAILPLQRNSLTILPL
jgi:hypothetical protein